jgi:hypothetical protein
MTGLSPIIDIEAAQETVEHSLKSIVLVANSLVSSDERMGSDFLT